MNGTNAKLLGNFGATYVRFIPKPFNFFNLFNGQFGMPSQMPAFGNIESVVKSVPHVLATRNPFKVFYGIVKFVSVFMVNLWQIFRVFQKRHGHDSVNQNVFNRFSGIFGKNNFGVSVWRYSPFQFKRVGSFSIFTKGPRSHLADLVNLVKPFVIFNWSPSCGNHQTLLGLHFAAFQR